MKASTLQPIQFDQLPLLRRAAEVAEPSLRAAIIARIQHLTLVRMNALMADRRRPALGSGYVPPIARAS